MLAVPNLFMILSCKNHPIGHTHGNSAVESEELTIINQKKNSRIAKNSNPADFFENIH